MDQRSVRDILAGKTYFIRTFGCQMNQHDSERVSGLLDSYGCLMALDPEHADIVVFMTCCVREAADTRLYGQCNSCKSLPPSPSGKRVVAVGDTGVERIFFTSSHPKDLLPETIDAMAETPAVMPQLHLAVQSGSTRILKEMNRRYTREDYLGMVDRIRNRMPDIALSTDIIVGFPGETEEDFEQTLSLAETVRYAQAYTFIYSKRAGTPAAEIDDPTPHEVILERFNRLVKVIETTAHEYNQGELHTVVPALIEGTSKKNDAVLLGKSPKNQTVHAPIPEGYSIDQFVGKIVDVDVDVAKTWYLSGSVVGEPR